MIWINDQEIRFGTFPNGETMVDEDQIIEACKLSDNICIKFKYDDDSDLIKLLFVKKYLDSYQVGGLDDDIYLVITYMPYSRMDRVKGYSVFTLKYITEFINAMNFKAVQVLDPHSDVTPALLNKCFSFSGIEILFEQAKAEIGFDIENDYIYFPDSTAYKRYGDYFIEQGYKCLFGIKQRDFESGRIKNISVNGTIDTKDFKVFMIDDLCSYGGTFILSAEQLKEMGASNINLIVAHCEKSIYQGKIFSTNLIDYVYTTESIITKSLNDRLKIFPITITQRRY